MKTKLFFSKQHNIKKNNKGFTLIELIVSMGLLVLVIWLAYGVFQTSGNLFNLNSEKADAQSQSRLIFQRLKIDIGSAASISIDQNNKSSNAYYVIENEQGNIFHSPGFIGLPVQGLNISYERSMDKPQILKVIVRADGNFETEMDLFSPNVEIFGTLLVGNSIIIDPAT